MNEVSNTYEVFCIHQGYAINLGLTWCREGHYPCTPNCPWKSPTTVTYTTTSTSTEEEEK